VSDVLNDALPVLAVRAHTKRISSNASLRRRLPFLIFAVLTLIGAAFAWLAHREVEHALRLSGLADVSDAARQVSDLLAQSAASRTAEATQLAADPGVRRWVGADGATLEPNGPAAVQALVKRAPQVTVAAYDTSGQLIRTLPATPTTSMLATGQPLQHQGVSPLRLGNGRVWYHTTVPVKEGSADAVAGYISIARALSSSSSASGLIERLVGHGAAIKLGNESGDIWTDLRASVSAPPFRQLDVNSTYTDANGNARIAAAAPVKGTPWLVWADISEAATLAPARTLVRRMLPITLLITALAALTVYTVSARVTRPIEQLAAAAEAIAGGDYSRRVTVDRRDEIGRLGTAFNVMAERVAESHDTLEARVHERTRDLERARAELQQHAAELGNANRELEAFSYSVSHDLRTPLRSIDGFAQALVEDCWDRLDDEGRDYLARIRAAAQRMGTLIDDLLSLSRVTRAELKTTAVDLSALVRDIAARLRDSDPARQVDWRIAPNVVVQADPALMRVALENLLGNAWKFTGRGDSATIEFTTAQSPEGRVTYVVRDNGAGFDMAHASKLFGAFQRMHGMDEFPGTGIGLATVQRIVRRHGGRIWAEARANEGAAFLFTLQA
jgi:signal transduction histidine kinase